MRTGKLTADGTVELIENFFSPLSQTSRWHYGSTTVAASGDFGGGTLTLQWSIGEDTDWVDAVDDSGEAIALEASGVKVFYGAGLRLRLKLDGATAPDIDWLVA